MLKMRKLRLWDINLSKNHTVNVFAPGFKPPLDLQSLVLQLFLSKAHLPCIYFKGVCQLFFTIKKENNFHFRKRKKNKAKKHGNQ